jgi:hypothetical protein
VTTTYTYDAARELIVANAGGTRTTFTTTKPVLCHSCSVVAPP